MIIIKTFEKFTDKESMCKNIYGISIVVKSGNAVENVFVDTSKMIEPNTVWIDINKLNSESFLKEHQIDYIIEGENKNIIPIGLVNFTEPKNYSFSELNIWNSKCTDLHKANQILENIERAIKIKYEAVKFINRFDNIGSPKTEYINLN